LKIVARMPSWPGALAALCLGLAPTAGAATPPAHPNGLRVRVEVRLGTVYNSNILQYSDPDQTAFRHHDPASRFAIRSIDDAAFRGSGSVALSRQTFGGRNASLTYTYFRTSYSRNPVNDDESHRVSLRQSLRRTGWVELNYRHGPPAYLRHLWDVDFQSPYQSYPRYQPAYVASRELAVEAGYRPAPLWAVAAGVSAGRSDYNAAFEERDAHDWGAVATADLGREAGPTLTLAPSFTRRAARGTDPSHPGVPDAERADISFREWGVSLTAKLPDHAVRRVPVEVRVQLSAARRSFTSHRLLDTSHRGRVDNSWAASINLERAIARGISCYGQARYVSQSTRGATDATGADDTAAYTQFVGGGGIRVTWSGRLP
jgi:hypothetical protein